MSGNYVTVSSKTLQHYWKMFETALRGYKAVRGYESYVLMESSIAEGTFTLRTTNDSCSMRLVLRADSQPSVVAIHADMCEAVEIDRLSRIIPFLQGPIDVGSIPGDRGHIEVRAGTVSQHLPVASEIADDFPSRGYHAMAERTRFACPDFSRRLRLAGSSATRNPKLLGTPAATTFFQVTSGGEISLESADPVRGVSRILWTPPNPIVTAQLSYMIPQPSAKALILIVSGHDGEIVVSSDIGGSVVGWSFGDLSYVTRSMGDSYLKIGVMYGGDSVAQASVPALEFRNMIDLICNQLPPNVDYDAKATIGLKSDGTVQVTSPTAVAKTEGWMNGTTSGDLPHTFTLNATQVSEILADMRAKSLIHLDSRIIHNNPILRITSPDEPDFLHIAVPFATKESSHASRQNSSG